ncbi:hypothetical protein SAY86_014450 [Trapa natans]|uniref:Uncharacterized protein n=1 Tax=Trapa natans TaxID=22666 RepID=A0AAN7KZ74_TRANT|nr:hypothetical protein SAY86_014450 [Trapa natans]
MLHRKVYSHGGIPFSWEDRPGLRKSSLSPASEPTGGAAECPSRVLNDPATEHQKKKKKSALAPPPPRMTGAPMRNGWLKKWLWRRETETDPFLAAYKECMKGSETGKPKSSGQSKKLHSKFGVMNKSSIWTLSCFSCMQPKLSHRQRDRLGRDII